MIQRPEIHNLAITLPIVATLFALALFSWTVDGAVPGFSCDTGTPQQNPAWKLYLCEAQPFTKYVRDDATWPYPSGWIMLANPTQPLTVKAKFDGWGDTVINGNFGEPNAIVIKSVYSHYPLSAWPDTQFRHKDLDMGGPLHGKNANGERFVATLNEIAARGYPIDYGAGIHLGGNCYGGMAAITQSLILPDPFWQSRITVVDGLLPGMTADPPFGKYWRILPDGVTRQAYWDPYDITLAQHSRHLDKLKNIYYRFKASSFPADQIGFNQNFMIDVCDKGKIACFATWGRQGHAWPDPEAPPEYQATINQQYSGPEMSNRLDQVLPIFTNSTANWYGERGHYNLGLEWKNAGFVDTPAMLVVPIRYRQHRNLGPLLPDQPATATFTLTLRHPHTFELKRWALMQYTIGDVVGYTVVTTDGEVKIQFPITLASGDAYTNVTLINTHTPGC